MKNIQLSSRSTDFKVLMAVLCVGSAAIMGLCVQPPESARSDAWMYLFDATICGIVALLVWAIFNLFNMQRFNGLPLGVAVLGSMVLWLLLVIGLMILIRRAVDDTMFQLTTAVLMKH